MLNKLFLIFLAVLSGGTGWWFKTAWAEGQCFEGYGFYMYAAIGVLLAIVSLVFFICLWIRA